MYCDSSGINARPSTTISCSATYKVTAISYNFLNYSDIAYLQGGGIATVCAGTNIGGGPTLLQNGPVAFANSISCTNTESNLTDTVTLMVK